MTEKKQHHSTQKVEKKVEKNNENGVEKKIDEFSAEAKEKISEISSEAKEKFDEASVVIKKEAKVIEKQGKKIRGSVSSWWNHASTAEKVTMILGVIFLALALRRLRDMVIGIVLLVLGLLGVTGFFVNKEE